VEKNSTSPRKKKSNHCLKPQKPPVIIIANKEDPIVIESDNNDISLRISSWLAAVCDQTSWQPGKATCITFKGHQLLLE
jgi:hypothetical protein